MENKIEKMFIQDCSIVFTTMIILWAVLIFTMIGVSAIAPNKTVMGVILFAGIMAGAFATTSAIAVLVHLRQNKRRLYLQELLCQ